MKVHEHGKSEVEWDDKPVLGEGSEGDIVWHGTCRTCGKRVHELYLQHDELFEEAAT